MKSLSQYLIIFITILLVSCGEHIDLPQDLRMDYPESFSVTIKDPSGILRTEGVFTLDVEKLKEKALTDIVCKCLYLLWYARRDSNPRPTDSKCVLY